MAQGLYVVAAVLVVFIVPVTHACSCYPLRIEKIYCGNRKTDIVEVKITEILRHIPSTTPPTEASPTSTNPLETRPPPMTEQYSTVLGGRKDVAGVVTKVFKGSSFVGQRVVLTSALMSSICGVGHSLNPGSSYIVATDDIRGDISVGLCGFFFDADNETVLQVLRNTDCSCRPKNCKLRIQGSRRVFRGPCLYPYSYCARDDEGTCRWQGVDSISCCTSTDCYYYDYDYYGK